MILTYAEHVLAVVGACALIGMIHHVVDARLERRERAQRQSRLLAVYEREGRGL